MIILASWYPLSEVGFPTILLKEKVSPGFTTNPFKIPQVILILASRPAELSKILVEKVETWVSVGILFCSS